MKEIGEMHPNSKPRSAQRLAQKLLSNGTSADDTKNKAALTLRVFLAILTAVEREVPEREHK